MKVEQQLPSAALQGNQAEPPTSGKQTLVQRGAFALGVFRGFAPDVVKNLLPHQLRQALSEMRAELMKLPPEEKQNALAMYASFGRGRELGHELRRAVVTLAAAAQPGGAPMPDSMSGFDDRILDNNRRFDAILKKFDTNDKGPQRHALESELTSIVKEGAALQLGKMDLHDKLQDLHRMSMNAIHKISV